MASPDSQNFEHWSDKPLLFMELDEERKRIVDMRSLNMDRGEALDAARQLPALILLYNNMEAGIEFEDVLYWCSFIVREVKNEAGEVVDVSVDWQITVPPHLSEAHIESVQMSLRSLSLQVVREVETNLYLSEALRKADDSGAEKD